MSTMESIGLENARMFPLIVLKDITDNFSEERVIGRGGSGVVYKGILDNGHVIAVKKLDNKYVSSGDGEAQFRNELMTLIGIKHKNIIQLVGYCYEVQNILTQYEGKRVFASAVEERILCLEYLQGGSLKNHLSDESCGLEWNVRYGIMKGICKGLKNLHTGYKTPIYHMDLKPENIFLDGNMVPKIGDFGISRLPADSMKTYDTQNLFGTLGYMPPEYVVRKQISNKFDVYSLGVIMIKVISGEEGYQSCNQQPSEKFIERVLDSWGKRQQATMSSHSLEQVKTCTEIALRCVEFDRRQRPSITDIVNQLNKIDAAQSSVVGGQNTEEEEHTTLEKQPDIQEQKKNKAEHSEEKMKEQVDGRSAISPLHSRWSGSQEQDIQGNVLHVQSGVQRLKDALPAMYNLIDEAEWRNHKTCVAELLPKLKDAVYDADDLLDKFRWCEMKVKLEGGESKCPFTYFFDIVTQGSFNKLDDVQGRMEHLSSQLLRMVPHKESRRFDKSIRPETSSREYEGTIFGRKNEVKQVMEFLNVPNNSQHKRAKVSVDASTSKTPSNPVSNESIEIPVLPIIGIGGVGKTTLAQRICSHEDVKSHFDSIVWICVSDDFDDKRLIKEVLSSVREVATSDNLDALQRSLSGHLNTKKFLIILDDMWDDSLKEHGQCWKRFYLTLRSARKGSMILITTRCQKVAEELGTVKPFELKGLQGDVLWNFFKLCVFGSKRSNSNPELEGIGRKILPKLKGSPLAAKTLGHMLRTDLRASHWNAISESELWELKQEATDILPALRLSYIYLPFYLKRCFSFCAVYPKDYIFQKKDLTEIWVAEGFVESEDIGCQYFEDLVARSFFQKATSGYVIHDLLHDMAQKVSEHDCFILQNKNGFDKIPKDVRHIYIQPSNDIFISDLSSLCNHRKLRTIFCNKGLSWDETNSVIDNWCTKLLHIRVLYCASVHKLPDSIGNLKHLRYLKISDKPFGVEVSEVRPLRIPSTFCWLYNLQTLYVKNYKISLPNGFDNLENLGTFSSHGFSYYPGCLICIDAASEESDGVIRIMKNLNQFRGDLQISNFHMLSKDQVAEVRLKNKKYLYRLKLDWMDMDWHPEHHKKYLNGLTLGCSPRLSLDAQESEIMQHNGTEVLEVLQLPISLRTIIMRFYPGVFLPSWFHPQNLPSLTSVAFEKCQLLDKMPFSMISQDINLNEISAVTFLSLTELTISECQNLSSLEHFLHPDFVPAIKIIVLRNCNRLVSVLTERFGDWRFLEELCVYGCPNISQSLVSSSLKQLRLGDSGGLLDNIDCCSVKNFAISTAFVTSIKQNMWSLPALQELKFSSCESLTSIGVSTSIPLFEGTNTRAFSKLKSLEIMFCDKLSIVDGLLTEEYVPVIERIHVERCEKLVSLPGEAFGGLSSLKHLVVIGCPCLNWQRGLVLPSSLKTLELLHCGDFSAWVPGCLENLRSLVSLKLVGCNGMASIPGTIWSNNLALLEKLEIGYCPNLVSIGGAMAVAKIKKVKIVECPKLKEAEHIMKRGQRSSRSDDDDDADGSLGGSVSSRWHVRASCG